ncbi:MAG: MaoC family dehydratase [Alphaproteobacteria bacterium]|nr:MaoC family dehydratase [Alphaproteobacteria bacterium]MDX5369908.1 MaoC family dehydratase [Alphaproteobacteria bacterium]MDX5464504.1 MaoC family dehydratase [Alphaproteobacteria bacterium]
MRVIESMAELDGLVGRELGVSDWVTIDQDRINAFADATGDHQWIHVDPVRAREELPTKSTIAHGYLTLSLLPLLMGQIVKHAYASMGINYGSNKVRFTSMVPVDSRVRARVTLKAIEARGAARQLTQEVTVEIDGADRPALVAEVLTLVYP